MLPPRLVAASLLMAVLGCQPVPVPLRVDVPSDVPPPPPLPSSATPAPSLVVTGTWLFGDTYDTEPTAGPAEGCTARNVLTMHFEGNQPVLERADSCGAPNERLVGALDGKTATFKGTRYDGFDQAPVTYQLTYHPMNGHWDGLRNGQPFWLAPRREPCASAPAGCSGTLRGQLYHQDGRLATEAGLHVRFKGVADVPVTAGRYVFEHFPVDLQDLEVTVEQGDQVLVKRTLPFGYRRYMANFGGPNGDADPEAASYGLPN